METLSFTLGILSVVAVILVATIVLGIVRVVKQHQQINSIQKEIEEFWRHNNQLTSELHQRISQSQNDTMRSIDETRSYINSRIDKLTSKQLLKS